MDPNAKDYMPIPTLEFSKGVPIPVDLFIRIGEEKFVMVAKASTKSDVEQFKSYQNREVLYLWVRKLDYHKLAHQQVAIAGIAMNKKELEDKQKTQLVSNAARSVFRQMDHLGFDLDLYNNAKQVTDAVIGLVQTNRAMSDLFTGLKAGHDHMLAHSVAVSALAVMIGQAMDFTKRTTLEKLAMGGMLHDIGMKALPEDLIKKPLAQMSTDEIHQYETHSYKGMQMLLSLGVVPDDVVSIVYEHHENSIGQGFPQRLRDVKMHPLARVIACADQYANLILPNVNNITPKNPRDAILFIEHTLGVPFNKDVFKALKRLVETDKSATAA